MSAITDLEQLLRQMSPLLADEKYVYLCVPGETAQQTNLDRQALACVHEAEGLTLILAENLARDAGLHYETIFGLITLRVHSSLLATGLTAAVSTALAEHGIPANLLAGYHHDHLLVPWNQAEEALTLLRQLARG